LRFATGKHKITSVEQILERFSFRDPVLGTVGPGYHDPTVDFQRAGNFDMMCNLFLFYSGQIRYKVRCSMVGDIIAYVDPHAPPQSGYNPSTAFSNNRPENGMNRVVGQLNPVIDFEAPFVSTLEVYPMSWAISSFTYGGGDVVKLDTFLQQETDSGTTSLLSVYIAGGKGFRMYYDFPPVPFNQWPYSYLSS